MTVSVLGHPSFEESYLSLANQSSTWSQAGWSEKGQRQHPPRKIALSTKWLTVLRSFYSALATGDCSFWNQTRQFPTSNFTLSWEMSEFNIGGYVAWENLNIHSSCYTHYIGCPTCFAMIKVVFTPSIHWRLKMHISTFQVWIFQ